MSLHLPIGAHVLCCPIVLWQATRLVTGMLFQNACKSAHGSAHSNIATSHSHVFVTLLKPPIASPWTKACPCNAVLPFESEANHSHSEIF